LGFEPTIQMLEREKKFLALDRATTVIGPSVTLGLLIFGLSFIYEFKTKTKLRGLSPRVNYTDRAIAACR
jgi:hypothetical protein